MKAVARIAAMLVTAVAAASPCAAQTAAPTQGRTPTEESMGILAVACIDNISDPSATRKWAAKAGVPGRKDEIAQMGHGVTNVWHLMTPEGAKLLLLLTKDDTCQVLATKFDWQEASALVERGYHAKLLGVSKGQEPQRRFYKVKYRGATMMLAITGAADANSLGSMVVYSEAWLRGNGMWAKGNGK